MLRLFKRFANFINSKRAPLCDVSFRDEIENRLKDNARILEIGCNNRPIVDKKIFNVHLHGIDPDSTIKVDQLDGIFDEFEISTLENFNTSKKFDLIILYTVLEHVESNSICFEKLNSLLDEKGVILTYQPSNLHPFSILNRILPHDLKIKVLKSLRPWSAVGETTGWKSYYDHCNPFGFKKLSKEKGLKIIKSDYTYNAADYFAFFPPLYLLIVLYEESLKCFKLKLFCAQFWVLMVKAD